MSEQKSLEQVIMEAIDFCTHTRCKKCEYYGKDSTYEHNGKCRGRMMADHLRKNGVVVRENGEWVDHGVRDWRCPKCGEKIKKVRNVDGYCYADKPNFCPNCGADLRKGENAE